MRRPNASVYFSPKRGAAKVLEGFIERTERTLDCAIYSLSHDRLADALIAAHLRGVKVRVLLDKTQAGGKHSDDERLAAAGIEVRVDTKHKIMHHKVAVADRKRRGKHAVVTGSFNWTANADEKNAENMIILRSKRMVDEHAAEFERLWSLNAPKT